MIPLIISQSLKGSLEDQPAAGGVCDGGRRGRGSGDGQIECGEGGRRAAREGDVRRGSGGGGRARGSCEHSVHKIFDEVANRNGRVFSRLNPMREGSHWHFVPRSRFVDVQQVVYYDISERKYLIEQTYVPWHNI